MPLTTKEMVEMGHLARNVDKLDDRKFGSLVSLRRRANEDREFVRVGKADLMPGEELWDFMDVMWTAVQTNRVVLADGSLDARLQGIYNDYVIVQDGNTGKLFKSTYVRNADGEFEFGEPVEVRVEYVEVGDVEKRAPDTVLELKKQGKWGFLPPTLRR